MLEAHLAAGRCEEPVEDVESKRRTPTLIEQAPA
jgi:hypothetical protein